MVLYSDLIGSSKESEKVTRQSSDVGLGLFLMLYNIFALHTVDLIFILLDSAV